MTSIKLMRTSKAAIIAARSLEAVLPHIRAGLRESDIAGMLLKEIKKRGASGFSFRPIVASGKRSALPHGRATRRAIKDGDIVVLDFGAVYKKYRSDITRTIVIGKPSAKQKRVFNVLLAAQRSAAKLLRDKAPACLVDHAARKRISDEGFGKYFIHSTGHGVGLKVHEAPKISRRNRRRIRAGTVVTIEPGIYIKGWGGMRIEDMYLVTKRSARSLTRSPKRISP